MYPLQKVPRHIMIKRRDTPALSLDVSLMIFAFKFFKYEPFPAPGQGALKVGTTNASAGLYIHT